MVHTYHERTRAPRQVEEHRGGASVSVTRRTSSGTSCGRIRRSPSTSTRTSVDTRCTGGPVRRARTPVVFLHGSGGDRARMVAVRRRASADGSRSASTPSATSDAAIRMSAVEDAADSRRGSTRRSSAWTSNARISSACRTAGSSRSIRPHAFPSGCASLTLLDPAGMAPLKLGRSSCVGACR